MKQRHRVSTFLSFLRVAMHFVENIRVSEERAQAGVGAEQDRPSAVLGAGK
jgi:hypothetical protein